MIRRLVILSVMLLSVGWNAVAEAPPATAPKPPSTLVPPPIVQILNQEYPGWTLARVSKQVQDQFTKHPAGHPPCVEWGDFDGDGTRDYVVQIARTQPGEEEQIVIAFLGRGENYEEIVLESRGLDPEIYLWSRKQRRPDAASYAPNQRLQQLVVVMGGPTGATSYGFENGSFHEVEMPLPESSAPAVE